MTEYPHEHIVKAVQYQAGKVMDQVIYEEVDRLASIFGAEVAPVGNKDRVKHSPVDDVLLIDGEPYQLSWSLDKIDKDEYEKEANALNN